MLNALIGDMIYVPEAEISAFGGPDQEADQAAFKELSKRVLAPDAELAHAPIQVNGSLSYVE